MPLTTNPSSRLRAAALTCVLCLVAAACTESDPAADTGAAADDSTGDTGDDTPHTTLLATVPNTLCDAVGVVGVQIQAVQVGCEHPPPAPCTMPSDPPPIDGDTISCPITDPTVTLGVRIEAAAEYQVEVVLDRAPDAETRECFAESVMQTSVLVTSVDLDVGAEKMLIGTGAPCPE
ncbi:MAG: hypothetical protein JNK45_13420 [Myxococcales bacterium]|nr:hypothetical protein [Myxococcales bacterium]